MFMFFYEYPDTEVRRQHKENGEVGQAGAGKGKVLGRKK